MKIIVPCLCILRRLCIMLVLVMVLLLKNRVGGDGLCNLEVRASDAPTATIKIYIYIYIKISCFELHRCVFVYECQYEHKCVDISRASDHKLWMF